MTGDAGDGGAVGARNSTGEPLPWGAAGDDRSPAVASKLTWEDLPLGCHRFPSFQGGHGTCSSIFSHFLSTKRATTGGKFGAGDGGGQKCPSC